MIRGCIFDADGTLLDSMKIWDDLGERYLILQGKNPEENLSQILFPMSLEESSAYLQKHYLPDLSVQEIQNGFMHLIERSYASEIPAKPGAVSFVHKLQEKNMPMMVATISDPEMIRSALQRLGILDCFMDVLDTVSMHTDKSQPDIYLKACQCMGTKPAETAVFEDTLIPLCTAEKADFHTVAVEDSASLSDRKEIMHTADLTIHDFTETERILKWMKEV